LHFFPRFRSGHGFQDGYEDLTKSPPFSVLAEKIDFCGLGIKSARNSHFHPAVRHEGYVKFSLTVEHVFRLLCIGPRRNLRMARSIQLNGEKLMTTQVHIYARVAQALLAVTATSVSALALQFAMLAV
jgi:hypothetical protein